MKELKTFILIIGLHIIAIALCALILQMVFIAFVYFYTGVLDIDLNNILVFVRAGAGGGCIAGFGVWLIYRFNIYRHR